MAFKYRQRSDAALDKRASQRGTTYEGAFVDEVQVFTIKKGDNFIRILPPTFEDAEHYGMDLWLHQSIGPEKATVICLSKMKNQPCPVCEARVRADRANDEELTRQLSPSRKVVVWMIDRNDEEKGPQVWGMSWTLDRDICKVSRDKRTGEVYVVDHPDQGYDVTFEREGEGIKTKYVGVQLSRRPSSVDQKWLDYIESHPIPTTFIWRTYAEVQALYDGTRGAPAPDEGPPARRDEPPPRDRDRDEGRPRDRDRDEPAPRPRDRDEPPARDAGSGDHHRDSAYAEERAQPRRDDPPIDSYYDDPPRDDAPRVRTRVRVQEKDARPPDPPPRDDAPRSRSEELRERFRSRNS